MGHILPASELSGGHARDENAEDCSPGERVKFDYYILNTYVPEVDGPPSRLYASWTKQVRLAEELGCDTAWFTEHHFRPFGGMLPSPQLLMASLAAQTSRIRLGTAISILPLHHPVRIAEDMAMLDVISDGRVSVGVGRGMPHLEYEVYGADWATAQEHLEEEAAILRGAWTERPFSWQGKHHRYPKPMHVLPPPVQQPHPPIWVTANFDESHFRWIGRQGFHLMTAPWLLESYDRSRDLIAAYRESLAEAGHDVETHEVLSMFPTHVRASRAEAADAGPFWQAMARMAFGERGGEFVHTLDYEGMVAGSRMIAGDAEACKEHVWRLAELGLTHIACMHHFGGIPQALVLESIRRFGEEVMPAFA
jgi:alkanesulfonate monooxygenase SsuD/methylene tetrahydromethanopterin reductase-like flavin-dependent oxidoreductase (luciferase family)